jgi:hypothetical protein
MMEGRKARRMRHLPSSHLSGELRDEPLAVRLRRIAEEQSKIAIEEFEHREEQRRAASSERKNRSSLLRSAKIKKL